MRLKKNYFSFLNDLYAWPIGLTFLVTRIGLGSGRDKGKNGYFISASVNDGNVGMTSKILQPEVISTSLEVKASKKWKRGWTYSFSSRTKK